MAGALLCLLTMCTSCVLLMQVIWFVLLLMNIIMH